MSRTEWLALFLMLLAVIVPCCPADAGEIRGRVLDQDSGDELIGVDVVLIGTGLKTASDIEGYFSFPNLIAGRYDLRLTYLGYNARFLSDVAVDEQGTTKLDVELQSFQAHDGGELVVQSARVMSTETALLAERKQSVVIGDGISAAQISHSPDGTSGEALKRVTGLTVTDGRYVIVRGMPDRYNVTHIDNVPVSGTDVNRDRKSFNFDMVPANLLSNLTVLKSMAPDMPGDATGGLIRVNTMEFPERATTAVGVSYGHAEGETGEDFFEDAVTGSTDWLGIDDGGRDFVEVASSGETLNGVPVNNDLGRALSNRWSGTTRKAPPKLSFNISHGNKTTLFGKDLGYLAALTYRSKYSTLDIQEHRQGYEDKLAEGPRSERTVLWGGIASIFCRLSDRHRIGVSNMYTRSAESIYRYAVGYDSDTDFERTQYAWQERYQYLTRLSGVHGLDGLVRGLDLDWSTYYGETKAKEPDHRFAEYNLPDTEDGDATMSFNRRSWTGLDEVKRGAGVDLAYSFAEFDFEEDYAVKIKAGVQTEKRTRNYDIDNWYSDETFNPASRALALLPMEEFFAAENYNNAGDNLFFGPGLNFLNDVGFSGDYTATHTLNCYYAMVDVPFSLFQEDVRLVGGVRYEDSDQTVLSVQQTSGAYTDSSMVIEADVLPSLNLTWTYDVDLNLRLAYYKSVNRPEFREMAGVTRRNYFTFQNERGNPDIKRAVIDNYDLRLEYFPRSGELLAASCFYKDLTDPIEEVQTPTAEGPLLEWDNVPRGKNYGFELEVRKRLDFLAPLRHFSVGANYTKITSEVKVFDNYASAEVTRTLQGQAPWMINLNLMYDSRPWGLAANVLYRKIGRRLDRVGAGDLENVYQEPRDLVDFVVTKRLFTHCKAKLAIKNVLDQNPVKSSGGDQQYEYSRIAEGREISVSISGKF